MQPNNGRPRPIPDFFLDGGVPPPPLIAATASGESPSMRRSGSDKAVSSVRRGSGSGKKGARGRGGQKGGGYGYGGGGRHGGWEWEHEEGTGDTDGVGEGEGDDGYQLEVTVYSHRVVGEGYGSHTEYTVLANASLPRFARREMEVARRYARVSRWRGNSKLGCSDRGQDFDVDTDRLLFCPVVMLWWLDLNMFAFHLL